MVKGNSQTTKIAVLQTQMSNIETKVLDGFKALKIDNERVEVSVKTDILRLENSLKEFITQSEKKFASKWVENAVSWAGYTIVGAVLLALIYLVVQK